MSVRTAREFLERSVRDKVLQKRLGTIHRGNGKPPFSEGLKIARAEGFVFSADDLREAVKEIGEGRGMKSDLSDADLARAADGWGSAPAAR